MVVQKLQEHNWKNRVLHCDDILQNAPANAVLLISDEAHIHLPGCVNMQDVR